MPSVVATGTASGVSFGEATQEIEKFSVDVVVYGMVLLPLSSAMVVHAGD